MVTRKNLKSLQRELSALATLCPSSALMLLVTNAPLLDFYATAGESKVAGLVHLSVATEGEGPYSPSTISYVFASPTAEQLVTDKLVVQAASELRLAVYQFITGNVGGGLCGVIAERLLHATVANGGVFGLQTGERVDVEFVKRKVITFMQVEDIRMANTDLYYMAQKSNEGAVDAVMPPRIALQMTIRGHHGVNYVAVKKLMGHLVGEKGGSGRSKISHFFVFRASLPMNHPREHQRMN